MLEKLNLTRKEWRRFIISLFGILILIILFFWICNENHRQDSLLNSQNLPSVGITIKTAQRKRGTEVQYYYFAKGTKYIDWIKIPVVNGEMIDIIIPDGKYNLIYHPMDPSINKIDLTNPIDKEKSAYFVEKPANNTLLPQVLVDVLVF